MRGLVAIITKLSPHYVLSPPFPVRDIVLIQGLLPIFFHSCEIKSGSGLRTRLLYCFSVLQGRKAGRGLGMRLLEKNALWNWIARIAATHSDVLIKVRHLWFENHITWTTYSPVHMVSLVSWILTRFSTYYNYMIGKRPWHETCYM